MNMSISELISKAEENNKWLNLNYERLAEKYNNECVGVLDRSVIDHDMNLKKLVTRLRKNLGERYSEVAIEYVTNKPIYMVLAP
jgi:hypothetical protein